MHNTTKFKKTELGLIPEDWEETTIGIKCKIKNGKTNTQDAVEGGKFPLYDRSTQIKRSNKFLFDCEAIIIPGEGKEFKPKFYSGKFDLHQRAYAIWSENKNISSEYIYYWIIKNNCYLENIAVGSTVKSLRLNHLENFPLIIPKTINEQKLIVKILKDLDSKIKLLQDLNDTLERTGQSFFKQWFVDFEFPNEEGNSYKSSGGEMVDSELGEIPKGWTIEKLGNIITNFDSKRIPLSSRERAKRQGTYPYYGATKIMDYVDKYIFDGTYLLISEDGSVTNKEGYPVLQYINGKFWVSNHAHIIQGKNCSTEFIYLLLLKKNIVSYITGAVQPKLNQANLNSIPICLPPENLLKKGDKLISSIFIRRLNIEKIIINLQKTRDLLLPKLMTGKIRVPLEVEE